MRQMSKSTSHPTLNDVASAAGVSTATVSRCLNSPDRVVDATRRRVEAAIKELGYTPNFAAQVMAAKRSHTIGAIIPTMENAIFARGLQAFQEELRRLGYTLLVASTSYRPDIEEEQVRKLVARGADGLLLIGHDRDPKIEEFLKSRNVAALVAWTYDKNASLPSIGFDNATSMRALAEVAIGMGHRKIGVITAQVAGNDRARQRLEGIRAACRAAGLGEDALQIVSTHYAISTGAEAFTSLMQGDSPPTLVMCGNDVLAAGAIGQARAMGLSVPEQVSITGFDDIELASVVVPALSTVHVPHRDMGRRAATMLVDMLEGRNPGEAVCLEADIRLRETLGPVRRGH